MALHDINTPSLAYTCKNFVLMLFPCYNIISYLLFKTPENAQGRVGIGTCGVSGQKMTSFSSANKYRRGT